MDVSNIHSPELAELADPREVADAVVVVDVAVDAVEVVETVENLRLGSLSWAKEVSVEVLCASFGLCELLWDSLWRLFLNGRPPVHESLNSYRHLSGRCLQR